MKGFSRIAGSALAVMTVGSLGLAVPARPAVAGDATAGIVGGLIGIGIGTAIGRATAPQQPVIMAPTAPMVYPTPVPYPGPVMYPSTMTGPAVIVASNPYIPVPYAVQNQFAMVLAQQGLSLAPCNTYSAMFQSSGYLACTNPTTVYPSGMYPLPATLIW